MTSRGPPSKQPQSAKMNVAKKYSSTQRLNGISKINGSGNAPHKKSKEIIPQYSRNASNGGTKTISY